MMQESPIYLIASRSLVSKEMREKKQNHKGMALWLTGLSGAGKSTLAHAAEVVLFQKNYYGVFRQRFRHLARHRSTEG